MAGHGPVYPVLQVVLGQVRGLAGDKAIAGHVAITIVHDVAVHLLVKGAERGDVWIWRHIYVVDLKLPSLTSPI